MEHIRKWSTLQPGPPHSDLQARTRTHVHAGEWILLAVKTINLQPQSDAERFICTPSANTHTHTHTSGPHQHPLQPSYVNYPPVVRVCFFSEWLCVCVWVFNGGGDGGGRGVAAVIPARTANLITLSCHSGTIPAALPPLLPLSPKRRHTAVIAKNKMSCQARKITQ